MDGEILAIAIVSVVMSAVVIMSIAGIIAGAVGKRGANRKELQQLRQDMTEMKSYIEDMREQLADIVIRLG